MKTALTQDRIQSDEPHVEPNVVPAPPSAGEAPLELIEEVSPATPLPSQEEMVDTSLDNHMDDHELGPYDDNGVVDVPVDLDDGMDDDNDPDAMVAVCMSAIADNLQTLGVEPEVSVGYASDLVRRSRRPGFIEVYGRGGFLEANLQLPSLNIDGLAALDLATQKPSGMPWDFGKASDRKLAVKLCESMDPEWIILSPQCTMCSLLNQQLQV